MDDSSRNHIKIINLKPYPYSESLGSVGSKHNHNCQATGDSTRTCPLSRGKTRDGEMKEERTSAKQKK